MPGEVDAPHDAAVADWRRAWIGIGTALMTAGATLLVTVGPLLLTGAIHAPLWLAVSEPAIAVVAFGFGLYCVLAASTGGRLPGRRQQQTREQHRQSAKWMNERIYGDRLPKALDHLANVIEAAVVAGMTPSLEAGQSPQTSTRDPQPQPPSQASGGTG